MCLGPHLVAGGGGRPHMGGPGQRPGRFVGGTAVAASQ